MRTGGASDVCKYHVCEHIVCERDVCKHRCRRDIAPFDLAGRTFHQRSPTGPLQECATVGVCARAKRAVSGRSALRLRSRACNAVPTTRGRCRWPATPPPCARLLVEHAGSAPVLTAGGSGNADTGDPGARQRACGVHLSVRRMGAFGIHPRPGGQVAARRVPGGVPDGTSDLGEGARRWARNGASKVDPWRATGGRIRGTSKADPWRRRKTGGTGPAPSGLGRRRPGGRSGERRTRSARSAGAGTPEADRIDGAWLASRGHGNLCPHGCRTLAEELGRVGRRGLSGPTNAG